jgi:hypothetical protein
LADVAFFAGLAFLAVLALGGALWGPGLRALAFLSAFGGSGVWAVSVVSALEFIESFSLSVITVTTWITLKTRKGKRILRGIRIGEGLAMVAALGRR